MKNLGSDFDLARGYAQVEANRVGKQVYIFMGMDQCWYYTQQMDSGYIVVYPSGHRLGNG